MTGLNALKFTIQINVFKKSYINKQLQYIPNFQFNDEVEVETPILNDHSE